MTRFSLGEELKIRCWTALALCALWFLGKLAHVSEHVTVERDPAAGVRLAGFLTAAGLILGRAVAGDWVSIGATVADFARVGSAALALVAIAFPIERYGRPTTQHPVRPMVQWGVAPALVYVGIAAAYVARLGIPE